MKLHRQIEDTILDLYSEQDNSVTAQSNTRKLARKLLLQVEKNLISKRTLIGLADTVGYIASVAQQQEYDLPVDYKKLEHLSYLYGNFIYTPKITEDTQQWTMINEIFYSKSHPEVAYIRKDNNGARIQFFPIPSAADTPESEEQTSTDADTVVVKYQVQAVTGVYLATDPTKVGTNYFTGGSFTGKTITLGASLPGATTAVLVDYQTKNITLYYRRKVLTSQDLDGTTTSATANKLVDTGAFTGIASADLVGRYVVNLSEETEQPTAIITARDDDNTLSIDTDIMGNGDDYAISNLSLIPEDHTMIMVYRTLELLYNRREDTIGMANKYKTLYSEALADLIEDSGSETLGLVDNAGDDIETDPYYPKLPLRKTP